MLMRVLEKNRIEIVFKNICKSNSMFYFCELKILMNY